MIITETALKLTKRYAAGAPCEIDFDNIKNTMFWPHYEKLAKETGEINRDVVRKYWFKIHNLIVLQLLLKGKYDFKKAKDCLVYSGVEREISEKKLIVAYRPLVKKEGVLGLSMGETIIEVKKESLEIEEGNIISFHGKAAAEIIDRLEAEALTKNTEDTIKSLVKSSK